MVIKTALSVKYLSKFLSQMNGDKNSPVKYLPKFLSPLNGDKTSPKCQIPTQVFITIEWW